MYILFCSVLHAHHKLIIKKTLSKTWSHLFEVLFQHLCGLESIVHVNLITNEKFTPNPNPHKELGQLGE